MHWQVGGKRTGRECIGAGICYSIIWQCISTRACGIYFPLAMPLNMACHREGSQGSIRDRAVAVY